MDSGLNYKHSFITKLEDKGIRPIWIPVIDDKSYKQDPWYKKKEYVVPGLKWESGNSSTSIYQKKIRPFFSTTVFVPAINNLPSKNNSTANFNRRVDLDSGGHVSRILLFSDFDL